MTQITLPSSLVSVKWLSQHLYHPDLLVFDASLAMPGEIRITEIGDRIGNAIFFDINEISDQETNLPHMMPSAEQFTDHARQLGVKQQSTIIVYDDKGIFSSARVWWMFKAMGFDSVAVLDGGLPAWKKSGYPVYNAKLSCDGSNDKRCANIQVGDFIAKSVDRYFCDYKTTFSALSNPQANVIDARSNARFSGSEEDPRPNVRKGHMPGAINLHYVSLFEIEGDNAGLLKPKDALVSIFRKISPNKNALIFSCGSGVTACILALAAHIADFDDLCVYDGSWAEWGSNTELPVVF